MKKKFLTYLVTISALLSTYAQAKAPHQIKNLKGLLNNYKKYCGEFPTTEQGLNALIEKPDRGPDCENYPASGFGKKEKLPLDPWQHPYAYTSDGKAYTITSWGHDAQEGGTGKNSDIVAHGP